MTNEILHLLREAVTALFSHRKIEVVAFFITVSLSVVLLYKFIALARKKKITHIDILYIVKDKDGSFSMTRGLSLWAAGLMAYIDVKHIDKTSAVNALWVHVFLIGLLQGLIRAVDIVAIKNGGYSTSTKTTTSESTTGTNPIQQQ
jgi:hypothetical protein